MTDRPTPSPDTPASSSSDYQAPKLYESSDLLAKYRTPAPDAPGIDFSDGSASEAVTSAGSSTTGAAPEYANSFGYATPTARHEAVSALSADALETLDEIEAEIARDEAAAAATMRKALLSDVATVANTIGQRGAGVGAAPGERVGDAMNRYAAAVREARTSVRNSSAGVTDAGTRRWSGMRPTDPAPGGARPAAETPVTQASKKSNAGLYLGIAAVLAAFLGWHLVTWPLAIVVFILGVVQIRSTAGYKVRGAFAVGLSLVAVLVALVNPIGAMFTDDGPTIGHAESTISATGASTVTGSGDATIDLVLPDGPSTPALLEITNTGDTMRVYEIDTEGEEMYSSVYSAYRESSGVGVINGDPLRITAGLSIEAEGDWTITLTSIDTLPTFDSTYAGDGDALFVYTGGAGEAVMTMDPDSIIDVVMYDEDVWEQYLSGMSSFTRPVQAGPLLIKVEAYEPWTIAVTPADGASVPAPDDATVPDEEQTGQDGVVPEGVAPEDPDVTA